MIGDLLKTIASTSEECEVEEFTMTFEEMHPYAHLTHEEFDTQVKPRLEQEAMKCW